MKRTPCALRLRKTSKLEASARHRRHRSVMIIPYLLTCTYALLRLLFAHPLLPSTSPSFPITPSRNECITVFLAALSPIPLLLILSSPLAACSYIALAVLCTRFTLLIPPSVAQLSLSSRALWRVEMPAFWLFTVVAQPWHRNASTNLTCRSLLALIALFVLVVYARNLHRRARTLSQPLRPLTALYLALCERVPSTSRLHQVPPTVYSASAFSLLSFQWVSSLISVAYTQPLQHHHVPSLREHIRSMSSSHRLRVALRHHSSSHVLRALRTAFGVKMFTSALPRFVAELCSMAAPLLLRAIIQYLQSSPSQHSSSFYRGLYLAACLFVLNMGTTILMQQFFLRVYAVKTAVLGALVHNVFEKTLTLSPRSRSRFESGQIQNIMATDCAAVSQATILLHDFWASLLQVCVTLVLLVHLLGFTPTLYTLLLVLLCIPIQSYIVRRSTALTKTVSQLTDTRVNLISELIKGIKLIKLYAWERPFLRRVDRIRQRELSSLRSVQFLNVVNFVLTSAMSTALTVVAFASYVALGHALDAAVVFPAIALFDILWPAMLFFPTIIVDLAKTVSSLSRLQQFLIAEEIEHISGPGGAHVLLRPAAPHTMYEFRDTVFQWGHSDTVGCLRTGSFAIPRGSLVAVVGSTAGGKSTLIAGMLGELQVTSGQFYAHPSSKVSYCPQVPFIVNATVRDNILFGKVYNKQLYETTVSMCCLLPDLRALPAGDATEIGSRGVNLSGGQRARVALARAVYSDADICLMDDPLSAIDANVGRHLFESCIASQMHGKTRILATNHLHVASNRRVDMVIVIHGGRVVEAGRRSDLLQDPSSEFSCLLRKSRPMPNENPSVSVVAMGITQCTEPRNIEDWNTDTDQSEPQCTKSTALPTHKNTLSRNERQKLLHDPQNVDYGAIEAGKLIVKETKEEGRVKLEHLRTYLSSMGLLHWVLPIALFKGMELVTAASVGVWMSLWSENFDRDSVRWYMFVFVLLGAFTVLFGGVSIFCMAFGSQRASLMIHRRLILSVMRAPISFFDCTPEGRLMNRFNSDIDRIDTKLAERTTNLYRLLVLMTIRFGMLVWAIPWFVVVILAVSFMLWVIQEYFRRATVDLRRLESMAYSPLYSHFAETIDGVATIRAFKDSPRMIHANSNHTDLMLKTTYATTYTRRWLSMRMNTVGCLLTLLTTIALMNSPSSRVSPSMKGLLLSYVVGVVRVMRWIIKGVTDLESQLSSVERISEYNSDSFVREEVNSSVVLSWAHSDADTKQQNPLVDDPLAALENRWPEKGRVEFDQVKMRYRADLEPALKGVSFCIESGEHIGIVGRTGAGKSTVIQSLFRLYELSNGSVTIDGVDISSLSLQQLRSKIGVIPQEAICFSGTIRSNLDMLNVHSETSIQRAFQLCGLAESTKAGLDFEVNEGGATLSVGQRQMMCLGRALLRQCKVVVLDEATSSVSVEIDSHIQETIRKEMDGCTVLTVAHRLDTVMRCDRIMVMDSGRVVEFGRPIDLLARKSALNDLVDETGPDSAAQLRKLAGVHPLRKV